MLNPDFKEFVESLHASRVEYLLVGGYALAAHGHPPRRIDLLTTIDGVDFGSAWSRRLEFPVDGVTVSLIGMEDFKANKRAAGRVKDQADLEALGEPPAPRPPAE